MEERRERRKRRKKKKIGRKIRRRRKDLENPDALPKEKMSIFVHRETLFIHFRK